MVPGSDLSGYCGEVPLRVLCCRGCRVLTHAQGHEVIRLSLRSVIPLIHFGCKVRHVHEFAVDVALARNAFMLRVLVGFSCCLLPGKVGR